MNRIIFFDIDGCFSTSAFKQAHGNAQIDRHAWDAFVATVAALDAQIVMNSMWRRPALLTGADPRTVLPDFARSAPFHVNAATPLIDAGARGDWALAWLERNPEVAAFAFLDDEAPYCLLGQNAHRFTDLAARAIKPDADIGVTPADLAALRALFPA